MVGLIAVGVSIRSFAIVLSGGAGRRPPHLAGGFNSLFCDSALRRSARQPVRSTRCSFNSLFCDSALRRDLLFEINRLDRVSIRSFAIVLSGDAMITTGGFNSLFCDSALRRAGPKVVA